MNANITSRMVETQCVQLDLLNTIKIIFEKIFYLFFVIVFLALKGTILIYNSISLHYSGYVISIVLPSSSPVHSSVPLFYFWAHPLSFHSIHIFLFSCKIRFVFICSVFGLRFSISLLRLSIHHLFKTFLIAIKTFLSLPL